MFSMPRWPEFSPQLPWDSSIPCFPFERSLLWHIFISILIYGIGKAYGLQYTLLLSSSHISYSSQQPLSISIFTIGIFDYFNTTTMKEMNSDRHFDLLPVSFAGFSLHHSRYIYFLFSTCTKQSIIVCYLFRFFIYKMHLRLHNGDIVKY